jgi:regulator of telomere elongation helicase 1
MEEGIILDFDRFYEMLVKGMEPSTPMRTFADYCAQAVTILADMLYLNNWAIDSWNLFFQEMYSIANGISSDKKTTLTNKYKVSLKMDGTNLTVKVICLDAARSFSFLKEYDPYCIILTSGTLSPMKFWQA